MSRTTISQKKKNVSGVIERIAAESSIPLPGGVAALILGPCPAPTLPPYGTRVGTWAEAESFLREWVNDGRDWVNIALHVSDDGSLYLCYEVPDRGDPDEPLDEGYAPSINLSGPTYDRRP